MTPQEQSEAVVATLNQAFRFDQEAVHALIVNRVPCNESLANHPTIQVDNYHGVIDGGFHVGAIGLLNGALAAAKIPLVASMFSDEADEKGVHKMQGFCIYQPPEDELE